MPGTPQSEIAVCDQLIVVSEQSKTFPCKHPELTAPLTHGRMCQEHGERLRPRPVQLGGAGQGHDAGGGVRTFFFADTPPNYVFVRYNCRALRNY